jgi:hypothetical protein
MGGLGVTAATPWRVKVASRFPESDLPIRAVRLTRLIDGP